MKVTQAHLAWVLLFKWHMSLAKLKTYFIYLELRLRREKQLQLDNNQLEFRFTSSVEKREQWDIEHNLQQPRVHYFSKQNTSQQIFS